MTTKPSKLRISKLPQWAQLIITHLEMRLTEAQATIKKQANPGPTRIDDGADFWAPNVSHVKFWLPDPEPVGDGPHPMARARWIAVKLKDDGTLELMGSQCLVLRTQAGNVVSAEVGDY